MVFFFSNDQMFPCLTSGQDSSERQQWDRKTTRRDSDSLFNWQSLQPAIVISTYSHLRHAPTKSVRVISMSAHSVRFCGQKTNSVFGSYFITSVNWCKGFIVAVKPALYPHPHAPCRLSQSISQGNTTETHNHRIWSWCENESQSVDKIMQTPRAKENPNFEVDHYYKGSYTGKLSWTPVSCVSASKGSWWLTLLYVSFKSSSQVQRRKTKVDVYITNATVKTLKMPQLERGWKSHISYCQNPELEKQLLWWGTMVTSLSNRNTRKW